MRRLAIVATTVALVTAGTAAMAASATRLVSVNRTGTASGDGFSGGCGNYIEPPSLSTDGRIVAFLSCADDLVATGTAGTQNVFVRDTAAAVTTLASVDVSGTHGGNAPSFGASLNGTGCVVAFVSGATNLVDTPDANGATDVFVRDLASGVTTLVSVAQDGSAAANGTSFAPALSADGRFVVFVSEATNLVATPTHGRTNVFVRDLQAGTTRLASVDAAGDAGGNGDSLSPLISDDGNVVAFESRATDLVALPGTGGAFGKTDVFVRDLAAGTTTLVSVNAAGTAGASTASTLDSLGANGGLVGFESAADDLVTLPTNGHTNVFVRDLQAGTTELVSVNRAGTGGGDADSFNAEVSDAGIVAFSSFATDVGRTSSQSGSGLSNVFARNLASQTTVLVSVRRGGSTPANGSSVGPQVSNDGRFVAFSSEATNLTYKSDSTADDIYRRDLVRKRTTLVSVNRTGTAAGNGPSDAFTISDDGSAIAFDSRASNLVANDGNGTEDVFVTRQAPPSGASSCGGIGAPTPAATPIATATGGGSRPTPTKTPSTTPAPTPGPLSQWRMYVQVARTSGTPTNANVPLRSGDAPLDVAVAPELLSAFPLGVHKTSSQITAIDGSGDTLAALTAAADVYVRSHAADYPGATNVASLVWASRAGP